MRISVGWGCDRDGFPLAGPRSHPRCLSSRHGCESTYLGFRMSGKIGRTLAASISNSGIFVLLLITFQSALLWYGAPCGVWAGKFILGQRRHALICTVKLRHMSCYLTPAAWPLLEKFLYKGHQVTIAHLERLWSPLGPGSIHHYAASAAGHRYWARYLF